MLNGLLEGVRSAPEANNVTRRVWAAEQETMYQLRNESSIMTVAVPWIDSDDNDVVDSRNLLIMEYFRWGESESLCKWKQTTADPTSFNRGCYANQTASSKPERIHKYFLNRDEVRRQDLVPHKSVGDLFKESIGTGPLPHIFYVHLIQHAIVDTLGNVITGNIKIFPLSCGQKQLKAAPDTNKLNSTIPTLEEVFVATQFWGSDVFHNMLESLPRLTPYLDFLKLHPNIKIHILQVKGLTDALFELMGIQPSRIVSGILRANVVYLPQGTGCGKPGVHNSQLLSLKYRTVIKTMFPPESLERNSIVVIKRTKYRVFKHATGIEKMVKAVAEERGYRYELFPDNPVPPFNETIQMFNRAKIIVAPHGAGLSNILFSEPGTVVIEGLCNPPIVNLCYQTTAYILGHRYHGLLSNGGCERVIDISPASVMQVLSVYLDQQGTEADDLMQFLDGNVNS